MQLHATDEVETYAAAVTEFLGKQPVQRNVLWSVLEQARSGTGPWSAPPGFWWVLDGGLVAGAASWTPPYSLLVSSLPDEACAPLATAALHRARRLGSALPGVTGPARDARAVAEAAARQTGAQVAEQHRLLVHELARLVDVPDPGGTARHAQESEAALVEAWVRAFGLEAGVTAGGDDLPATVRHWLAQRSTWVWVDEREPRSTASLYLTGGVARVIAVYTPPEHRGRGYARRLVYEVTAAALGTPEIAACTLNTDATNPVSNAIYRQMGYVPVAEHAEYALVAQ